MSFRFGLPAAACALLAAASPASAAFDLNFSSVAPGTTIPFNVTTGDNKLTFTSTDNPGSFSVANSGLYTNFGAALGDYSSFSGDTLRITFSKPVTGLTLSFGIEDAFGINGGDYLTVTTDKNQVFTLNAAAGTNTLSDPEGIATFYAKSFLTATISSGAAGSLNPFAIGEIASVPEPAAMAVLGAGLLGLAGIRRRG